MLVPVDDVHGVAHPTVVLVPDVIDQKPPVGALSVEVEIFLLVPLVLSRASAFQQEIVLVRLGLDEVALAFRDRRQ